MYKISETCFPMAVIHEEEYDFLLNTDDELMLVFYGLDSEPKNPTLALHQREYVLLTRAADEPQIRMDDVPDEIWEHLYKVKKVLVCEIDEDGEFKHVYDIPVVIA